MKDFNKYNSRDSYYSVRFRFNYKDDFNEPEGEFKTLEEAVDYYLKGFEYAEDSSIKEIKDNINKHFIIVKIDEYKVSDEDVNMILNSKIYNL